MDTIILRDKTELEIEESNNAGGFQKRYQNPQQYLLDLVKLTPVNLSSYQVKNSSGGVVSNPENKECLTQNVTSVWASDGTLSELDVVFNLSNVDMVNKRLMALEETTDTLVMESLIGGETA